MDVTILLEDDKPVSVDEAPDYPEDIGADLKETAPGGGGEACKPTVGWLREEPAIHPSEREGCLCGLARCRRRV